MRYRPVTHRAVVLPGLGLVLAVAATACSSSSSSPGAGASASTSATAPPSAAPTSASPSATGGGSEAIKANWEAFFNPKTPTSQRIALLQNGQTFASVIQAQSGSSLASSATATVSAVTVQSPTQAKVTYSILVGGTPALKDQTGVAVLQDGTWKVGDQSFCALLTLENNGKAPSVCASATS